MVVFNSQTHQHAFLNAIPEFLNRGKDFTPKDIDEKIRKKSCVCYPGISLSAQDVVLKKRTAPPLIIWNHRWGFDKNHHLFFKAVETVRNLGHDFRLALLGDDYGLVPDAFSRAKETFKDEIVQFGFVPSRKEYINWLAQGSIVVSTAGQENYGMSVIEAMIMGCLPLLPDRLSYPEILPEDYHASFLYKNAYDLEEKLACMLRDITGYDQERCNLSKDMTSLFVGKRY